MKKLASLLAVFVLAAGAFFAYRCHVAAERLRSIASSGEYRALGLKLILSAPKAGVKGLLRFQPYLEIPQVQLDASAWGLPERLMLGVGKLRTGLWNQAGLRLVLDGGEGEVGALVYQRLNFELGLPDQIISIRAKSILFAPESAEFGQSLLVQSPWLQLRPGEGKIPAQLNLRFESLTLENREAQERRQRLQVGVTELGYALEPEGEGWKWRAHFRGRGAACDGKEFQGEAGSWSFVANGLAAKSQELKEILAAKEWQALPQALVRLRPRIDRLDFQWGGFDLKEGDHWSLGLRPLDVSVHYLPGEKGYGWKLSGRAQGMSFAGKERKLELQGFRFEESMDYRDLQYPVWLDLMARSYAELFQSPLPGERVLTRAAGFFPLYMAHLPDALQGEMGLDRLSWEMPGYQAENRHLKFGFAAQDGEWNYRLSGEFDSHSDSGFPPEVQGAKIEFDFGFPFPYREVIAAARLQSESRPSEAWFQPLVGKEAGLDWKWKVDLGSKAFAFDFHLLAKTELEYWLEALSLLGAWEAPKPRRDLGRALLKQGRAALSIKVERLSQLQALMDQIKSGSSLALALAGAYVVVDPKADTLSLELHLQEGEILLNGSRSVSLETLLKKRLGTGK